MILPTKGLSPERSLMTVGAGILRLLETPSTPSALWSAYKASPDAADVVTFDWFVLALDFLRTIHAVELDVNELIMRTRP